MNVMSLEDRLRSMLVRSLGTSAPITVVYLAQLIQSDWHRNLKEGSRGLLRGISEGEKSTLVIINLPNQPLSKSLRGKGKK